MRPEEDTIDDKPMPLLDHLLELRQRLLLAFGGFVLAFIVCYVFSKQIYGFLAAPLANILQEQTGAERRMIFTALYEAFFTYLKVALWGAMMISFPWWAFRRHGSSSSPSRAPLARASCRSSSRRRSTSTSRS